MSKFSILLHDLLKVIWPNVDGGNLLNNNMNILSKIFITILRESDLIFSRKKIVYYYSVKCVNIQTISFPRMHENSLAWDGNKIFVQHVYKIDFKKLPRFFDTSDNIFTTPVLKLINSMLFLIVQRDDTHNQRACFNSWQAPNFNLGCRWNRTWPIPRSSNINSCRK